MPLVAAPRSTPKRGGPEPRHAPSGDARVLTVCEHVFVRWSNLTIDEDEGTRLPGYRDPATIRRFDAPEALDIRFYEIHARSAINRVPEASQMPFRWTINPYRGCTHACLYCYARTTHAYLDFNAGRDFEREIVVKVNAPEVVRAELAKPSWKGEHVAMGTNTDPYQWVESRYKLMPGIWEAMRDARNPCSILTKSPLLLRDIELMKEIAAVTDIHANLSIPTLDAKAWRATEPHTPHPKARLEAVAELNRAGIPCGVLIAPLMPGINDAPEQVEPLLEAAAAAGGDRASAGSRCTCAATSRRCSSTFCAPIGPTSSSSTRSSTPAAPTRRRRSASGWQHSSAASPKGRGRAALASARASEIPRGSWRGRPCFRRYRNRSSESPYR